MTGSSSKARIWFGALLRSAVALVSTLIILAVFGGVTDVVLHTTRHTSSNSQTFNDIDVVDVVLDGDISVSVLGQTDGRTGVTVNAVDTSTVFDEPARSTNVIGKTLYLTERCPDSRCTAQLTLMLNTHDRVNVIAGNALRLDQAVIDFSGLAGGATVQAAPGKLVVTGTVVTGAILGAVECDTIEDCGGIATTGAASQAR